MGRPSIDFETRSECDIKLGAYQYATHPSTEILMIAWKWPGEEPQLWDYIDGGPIEDLLLYVQDWGQISAWNTMFEYLIWNHVGVKKLGWPPLHLEQCFDTMAQAAQAAFPQSLDACCSALGLNDDVAKMKEGKKLIRKFCVPRKPSKTNPDLFFRPEDFPEEWQQFKDYCKQDTVAEAWISEHLDPLSDYEQSVWQMTQRMNLRGVPVAVDEIDNILTVLAEETKRLNDKYRVITGNTVPALTNIGKLVEWLADNGVETESLDAENVQRLIDDPEITGDVRKVLELRQSAGRSSPAKFKKIKNIVCDDGTVKLMLAYCGAGRTGRYASRGGLNLQNLARPPIKDAITCNEILAHGDHELARMLYDEQVMDAIVSALRGVLKAPEGRVFMDADFSGIENRTGPWLAGDEAKLELFRKGLDEYKEFATEMYPGTTYEGVTGDQRQVSKSAVLGGIFGQGGKGFQKYAEGYGVFLDLEEAQRIINIYREKNEKIVSLWYTCGRAALEATRNPGRAVPAGDKLAFRSNRKFLQLRLPSGRKLYFYQPRVESQEAPWGDMVDVVTHWGINSYTRKWERQKTIGSKFFQNATQATARDLMVNALMNLDKAGFELLLTVHDEGLGIADIGDADLKAFEQTMLIAPAWAKGLPLDVEGWIGDRFRK